MAEKQDIEIIENNDTDLEITVTKDGAAYDLTGMTAEFYAKTSKEDADAAAVMTYTSANGRAVVVPGTGGRIDIAFRSEDVVAGKYPYHLDVIESGGDRHTVAYGNLKVINV